MKLKSYFEVYQGKNRQFYWRLRASNHKQVADGSEGYVTKQGAERGIVTTLRLSCGIQPKWEAGTKFGPRYSTRYLRVASVRVPVRYLRDD